MKSGRLPSKNLSGKRWDFGEKWWNLGENLIFWWEMLFWVGNRWENWLLGGELVGN